MSRVIKFRAWDVINKKMYKVAYPTWNGGTQGKLDPDISHDVEFIDEDGDEQPIVMQFTGLTDKNGKEIWEFDLMETPLGGLGLVTMTSGMWAVMNLDKKWSSLAGEIKDSSVNIGSIFEDIERLEKERIKGFIDAIPHFA